MRTLLAALIVCLSTIAQAATASWYGSESGSQTASGARFNPSAMTAAHRTLPFGTMVRVCRRGCVVVRINDRGPFVCRMRGKIIVSLTCRGGRFLRDYDLSRGAARAIGLPGVGEVSAEIVR
jgi:rare lipoprotein A